MNTDDGADDTAAGDLTDEQLTGDPGMPAYSLSGGGAIQPQCSGFNGRFCFFCAFEPQKESGGNEHPDSLRSFVRALIEQKVEVPVIVRRVKAAYDESVRQSVEYRCPDTGKVITAPEWTVESIQTHIVYSKEFPDIFADSIEQMFLTLITNQNNNMISTVTRQEKPEVVESFLKTVRALSQYRESRNRLKGLGVRSSGSMAGKKT